MSAATSSGTTSRNAWLLPALMSALVFSSIVRADDLAGINGLWATDASNCDKIFTKTGQGFSFAKDSDLYGSGFIIDGRKVVTPVARCDIKTSKQDGAITHLIAGCATDIMLSNMQASFKMIDKDKILRIFPAVSEMEIPFERCVMQ
jgi:hypothetical protein